MGFRVMKGPSRNNGEIDSIYPKEKDANKRRVELLKSLRGGKMGNGKKVIVWIEPATKDDPVSFKKKPSRWAYY